MPDAAHSNPLEFTLGDHDRILKCASGVDQIIEKLTAFDKRIDVIETSFATRVLALEDRVKSVEDWKLRVMAIVSLAAFVVGAMAHSATASFFGK
jgi:hypothetical protein